MSVCVSEEADKRSEPEPDPDAGRMQVQARFSGLAKIKKAKKKKRKTNNSIHTRMPSKIEEPANNENRTILTPFCSKVY